MAVNSIEVAGAGTVLEFDAGDESGNFVGPTIFTDVKTDMDIYTNEIFGPVLVVLTAQTLDDAIAIVNANPFGNIPAPTVAAPAASIPFFRNFRRFVLRLNTLVASFISRLLF